MPEKAEVKFNGGNLALLCQHCRVVIKEGYQFTPKENQMFQEGTWKAQSCDGCRVKHGEPY